MGSPRCYEIYKNLPSQTRKGFRQYLDEPRVNRREKLRRLAILMEERVEEEADWHPERVCRELVKGKILSNLQLNNLLSDLQGLLFRFLAIDHLEGDEEMQRFLLYRSLHSYGVKQALGWLGDPGASDTMLALQMQNRFEMHRLYDDHLMDKGNTSAQNLEQGVAQLDTAYALQKLQVVCELMNRKRLLGVEFNEQEWESFFTWYTHMEKHREWSVAVRLYYRIWQWLDAPEEDDWYEGYLDLLLTMSDVLPAQYLNEWLIYVQNYCVLRINEGRREYLHELLRVYQLMVQTDVLVANGQLSEWTYKNVVTVGSRTAAFDWTEQFIHQHYMYLPDRVRDNAYMYNLAVLYHAAGQRDRCQQLLMKVRFTDPVYYLDAKCLLLRIYFEQQEEEAIYSLRETVNIYLLRQKALKTEQKKLYRNLFRFALRLFRLKHSSAHLGKEKKEEVFRSLQEDIRATMLIANRSWLEEQFEETIGPSS